MLDSSQVSPHYRSRSMNVGDVLGIGGSLDSGPCDKVDKTKVMLGIESKLMKAIKEVRRIVPKFKSFKIYFALL
jgi:hypothetical protein